MSEVRIKVSVAHTLYSCTDAQAYAYADDRDIFLLRAYTRYTYGPYVCHSNQVQETTYANINRNKLVGVSWTAMKTIGCRGSWIIKGFKRSL